VTETVRWASEELGVPSRTRARTAPRVGGSDTPVADTAGEGDWTFRHRRELYLLAAVLAPATALRMAGADPWWSLAALGVTAAATALWRHRGRPGHRPGLEVVGGCSWPLPWRWGDWRWQRQIERETARLFGTWESIVKDAGVPTARLRRVVHDPDEGYEIHVEAFGKLATDVKVPRFHSAAGIAVEWTIQTPDLARPWEFVIREAVAAEPDDLHDDETPAWSPPAPVELKAERLAALRIAVDQLGPELVSAAGLGWHAARIPRDWMAEHIEELAPQLGLRRVGKKWQRLAVAAGGEL